MVYIKTSCSRSLLNNGALRLCNDDDYYHYYYGDDDDDDADDEDGSSGSCSGWVGTQMLACSGRGY